jgi:hypothetical protein
MFFYIFLEISLDFITALFHALEERSFPLLTSGSLDPYTGKFLSYSQEMKKVKKTV